MQIKIYGLNGGDEDSAEKNNPVNCFSRGKNSFG